MKSKLLALILTVFLIPVAYAMMGDADGDNITSPYDFLKLQLYKLNSYQVTCYDNSTNVIDCLSVFDFNGDGIVTKADEIQASALVSNYILGDADGDRFVSPADINELNKYLLNSSQADCGNYDCSIIFDLDGDGSVGQFDLNIAEMIVGPIPDNSNTVLALGIKGDLDGDGVVSPHDLVIFRTCSLSLNPNADQCSKTVGVDEQFLVNTINGLSNLQASSLSVIELNNNTQNLYAISPILGDADGDGVVSPDDNVEIKKLIINNQYNPLADLNNDGFVNDADLNLLQEIISPNLDKDNDNYLLNVDCNDNDASINPDAAEINDNDVDENCDGIKGASPVVSSGGGSSGGSGSSGSHPVLRTTATQVTAPVKQEIKTAVEEPKVPGITGATIAETGNSNLFDYLQAIFLKIVNSAKNLFA